MRRFRNMPRTQPELLQQCPGRAGVSELVVDADALHRAGQAVLCDDGAHRLAQSADDGVLLTGDEPAALLCRVQYQTLVQRLDGGHVDDTGADTLLGQQLGSFQRLRHQQAVGNEGHIGTLPQDFTFPNLKSETVCVVDDRRAVPAEPHIDGALVLIGGPHHGFGLHVVCR